MINLEQLELERKFAEEQKNAARMAGPVHLQYEDLPPPVSTTQSALVGLPEPRRRRQAAPAAEPEPITLETLARTVEAQASVIEDQQRRLKTLEETEERRRIAALPPLHQMNYWKR
jgi:hypothetical protein